jgi:1A family penicillin-binding protein
MYKHTKYGYLDQQENLAKTRQKIRQRSIWRIILFLPFKILWLILALLWKLWQRRPRVPLHKKQEFRKKMLLFFIASFAILFIFGTILTAWISKDLPDPDKLTDRKIAQSTKIYDRTGEHLLYEIYNEKRRTIIEFDQIPKQLINAVIATEDKLFYEHKGIRPLSMLRAIVLGLLPGKRIEGTSTLTQQLVKNAILTNERSYVRKIKEIILSIRLEQKYSKDQILKIYFNEIPYGSTNYGVQAASQNYFNKDVTELSLQELATLAGLPQAPSKYLKDKVALKQRRDFVLRRMFEEGYITEDEKNKAQAEQITLERRFDNIKAPHFVLYVKEQLIEQFGENLVNTGGLKVITTLDWEKQEAAEKAISEIGKPLLENAGANNASLVAIDPKNGNIVSMIGSFDFFNDDIDGQFNVATQGKRQPGSSFKPIIYAAAFEKGYTPETILFDAVTNFAVSGKSYKPLNYNLQELGPVTMRQALQGSLNIPAVQTLYLVGPQKGIEFAKKLGYTTFNEGSFGLSLVLGGGEIIPLEHVIAYSIFANGGMKYIPVSILEVNDNEGQTLYKAKQQKGERVLDASITATLSNVLSDDASRSFIFGSGSVLTLPGRQVAVKTGTTNNYVDAWTVGYTPDLVTGVWVGNTNNSPMKLKADGSKVAAPIWNFYMKESLKDSPILAFPEMPANDAAKPILRGSAGGSITLPINKITGNIATSSTPEYLIIQKTFLQPHSILHYVDKDNPRGEIPVHPELDPQYFIWEQAIQDWIKRKQEKDLNWNISFEEPPTKFDDEYSIGLMPSLEILYPAQNQKITSRQIVSQIKASAPRGIAKVSYKIDDAWVEIINSAPFNLNYYARGLSSGPHILSIIAEDDIGNKIEEKINFILEAEEEKPGAFWVPVNSILNQNDFPRVFFLDHYKLVDIREIVVYSEQNGNRKLEGKINDFSNLINDQLTIRILNKPNLGELYLIADTFLKNGGNYESDKIKLAIQ